MMSNLNFICGMPRSGSTLLVNLFNQNPNIHSTHTSPLPLFVSNIIAATNTLEYKNDLSLDKGLNDRLVLATRSFCETYHSNISKPVIFDKNRLWGNLIFAAKQLNPDSRAIVCVRDLREIFGSCVKQDRKHPMFVGTSNVTDLYAQLFGDKGLVGQSIKTTIDLFHNKIPNVAFLPYPQLTKNPKETMENIYGFIGIENFQHNFEKVENTCREGDVYYNLKYPHNGEGKVEYRVDWKQYVPDEIEKDISTRFAVYQNAFGFQDKLIRTASQL